VLTNGPDLFDGEMSTQLINREGADLASMGCPARPVLCARCQFSAEILTNIAADRDQF